MKTIDPRMAERRKQVAADHARGSARRVLRLLVLVGVIGLAIWVARGPWFAVSEIRIDGAVHTDVVRILDEAGVRSGRPLLIVPVRGAEEALLASPWVSEAAVSKVFPDGISVVVIERTPKALVSARGEQVVVSADGSVLAEQVAQALPMVRATTSLPEVGDRLSDPNALGSIEFLAELDAKYLSGTSVSLIEGELWARIGEIDIRLGRPVDMAEKARSLSAVLDVGQEPGSIINVIAPARPTVLAPGGQPST